MCVGGGDTEFGWRSPAASQSWRIAALQVHEYPACPYVGQVLRSRSRTTDAVQTRAAPPEKRTRERRREMRRKSVALKARKGPAHSPAEDLKPSARFASPAGRGLLCDPLGARPSGRAPILHPCPSRKPLTSRALSLSIGLSRPQSRTGRIGGLCKSQLTQLSCSTHAWTPHARMSASRATPKRHVL